ncbi:Acg family FMN-binding oxidoreductase [Yinghuangia seranimata]|uniref:Acg family FMN-binding oxidoreductase n=1 Tax=Yinghuangia seranimata TaxID=408067 RepID=UPI00248B2EB2|nr:nitroreductase family protein [Yinghuangia seranimata]MDI2124796.1 nitroreductase family protein [Yinghuangia seranimata]
MTPNLSPKQRETILRAATSAPSKYNTQPWWFRWDGDDLEVHIDPARSLRHGDPAGREAHIACGAAAFAARLGYASFDTGTAVERLPDHADPLFVARVQVVADAPDPRLAALYPFLPRRRTDRGPFHETAIPTAIVDELCAAAREEEARLRVVDWEPAYEALLTMVREATGLEEDELRDERARWIDDPSAAARHEGVPAPTLGPRPEEDTGAVRDLAVGRDIADRGTAAFEARPLIALLETRSDTRYDWLAAGQALQRLLLAATRYGVAASFANQPLENPDLRAEAGRLTIPPEDTHFAAAQMILRLGLSTADVPPSPPPACTWSCATTPSSSTSPSPPRLVRPLTPASAQRSASPSPSSPRAGRTPR